MLEILFTIVVLAAGLTILAIALRRAPRCAENKRATGVRRGSGRRRRGGAARRPTDVGSPPLAPLDRRTGGHGRDALGPGLEPPLRVVRRVDRQPAGRATGPYSPPAQGQIRTATCRRHRLDGRGLGRRGQRRRRHGKRHARSRAPLQSQLEDVIGRIRLGDNPPPSIADWPDASPWRPSSSSAPPWRCNGRRRWLPTLAGVGRTIRDRIDISAAFAPTPPSPTFPPLP